MTREKFTPFAKGRQEAASALKDAFCYGGAKPLPQYFKEAFYAHG